MKKKTKEREISKKIHQQGRKIGEKKTKQIGWNETKEKVVAKKEQERMKQKLRK